MLTRSNIPGKHEAKQKESSARKARSVHANIYMASASGGATPQVIRSDKGVQVMAGPPTESEWFTRFMPGLHSSIGERINQDAYIYIALMIEMQQLLELGWNLAVKQSNKEHIRTAAENGLFHNFTYCGSLRIYDSPKVLLRDLSHHIFSPEESVVLSEQGNYPPPHIYLPLLGNFKSRSQEEQRHIIDIY